MNAKTLDGEIITNRLDDWRLYQGVRTSRIFAFLIDYVIVFLPVHSRRDPDCHLWGCDAGSWLDAVRHHVSRCRPCICRDDTGRTTPGDQRHADDGPEA